MNFQRIFLIFCRVKDTISLEISREKKSVLKLNATQNFGNQKLTLGCKVRSGFPRYVAKCGLFCDPVNILAKGGRYIAHTPIKVVLGLKRIVSAFQITQKFEDPSSTVGVILILVRGFKIYRPLRVRTRYFLNF